MKVLVGIAMLLVLCGCESMPQVQTSMNYNGQSFSSMDLTDPHFYMDDDNKSSSLAAPQMQQYSVDPFCASTCQSRGGTPNACNSACGF
jgi:hypothetical protein